MAVDAQTGAVLRVQVTAVNATSPAVDIGSTAFDPSAPPADVFALGTQPGATVEQMEPMGDNPADESYKTGYEGAEPDVSVVGDGWTSVVVLPADAVTPPAGAGEPGDDPLAMLPPDLLSPVEGGSVLSTALLSVMLADDGRVLVGAVTPEVLAAASE